MPNAYKWVDAIVVKVYAKSVSIDILGGSGKIRKNTVPFQNIREKNALS